MSLISLLRRRSSGFPVMEHTPMVCGPTTDGATIHFSCPYSIDAYVQYGPEDDPTKYQTSVEYSGRTFSFTIPDGEADFEAGSLVYYNVCAKASGGSHFFSGRQHIFRLARRFVDTSPWSFEILGDSWEDEANLALGFADAWDGIHSSLVVPQPEFAVQPGQAMALGSNPAGAWKVWRGRNGIGGGGEKCGDIPIFMGGALGDDQEEFRTARAAAHPAGHILTLPGQQTAQVDPHWNQSYFYWTWGNALFIVLDEFATVTGTSLIGTAQRAWLEAVLYAHRAYRWKFVFSYRTLDENPPDGTLGHTALNGYTSATWLLDRLDRYGVQVYAHSQYQGWRHVRDSKGRHYICSNFMAGPAAEESGDWYSGNRFFRAYVGMRWDADAESYVESPNHTCLAVCNPWIPGVDGEEGRFNILATDNPAEILTTTSSTTTTTQTTTIPYRHRFKPTVGWTRSGLTPRVSPLMD